MSLIASKPYEYFFFGNKLSRFHAEVYNGMSVSSRPFSPRTLPPRETLHHFAARCTPFSPDNRLTRSIPSSTLRAISLDRRTENSFALRARRNRTSRPRLASEFKRTVFPLPIVGALHSATIYVRPQLGVDHFRSNVVLRAFRGGPAGVGRKRKGVRERERERERGSQRETGTYHGGCGEAGSPGSEKHEDVAACQDELATEGDTSARIDTRTSAFSRFAS